MTDLIRLSSVLLCVIMANTNVFSQVKLKIEINNLYSSKGHVLVDFRDENDQAIKGISKAISNKKCVIIVNNLKPGKYAFRYFHDENDNKKIDKYWIGAPKEGFGFSNDVMGLFGPPEFEDTIFEVKENTTIKSKAFTIRL